MIGWSHFSCQLLFEPKLSYAEALINNFLHHLGVNLSKDHLWNAVNSNWSGQVINPVTFLTRKSMTDFPLWSETQSCVCGLTKSAVILSAKGIIMLGLPTSPILMPAQVSACSHCLDLDLNGKKPGITSNGNFSSYLIGRSWYNHFRSFSMGGNWGLH